MIRRFKMKRFSIYFLVISFLFGGQHLLAQSKTKYKAFKPSRAGDGVFLKSDSKRYRYYVLEEGKAIYLDVTGPAKIKLRSRADLGGLKSGDYDLYVWEGKELIGGRKAETSKSKLILDGANEHVGLARDIFFKVPRGNHIYSISARSEKIDKFYLRFYQEKKSKKKPVYIPYRPYDYSQEIKLKTQKSEIPYYLVKEDGGARLKVIGPTRIRIYCRANFNTSIEEKSKFALGAYENGKSIEKFTGIAKKSQKVAFSDLPDQIPSTLHKFYLDIPSGEHIYEFKKVNSPAPNLAVRFKILEQTLGKKK
jgi:hypothetical protein